MNIDTSLTLAYTQLLSRSAAGAGGQTAAAGLDFSAFMVDIAVSAAGTTGQPQTVEDVKQEFYSYLDSLALSSGLASTPIRVDITDAAFEKMLVNPEYKQRMKDLCARDLCDPGWNKAAAMGRTPSAMVITIDADCEEEYLATSYHHPDYRSKADGDGFWNRRAQKSDSDRKAQEKRRLEKEAMQELLGELAAERKQRYREFFAVDSARRGASPDSFTSSFSAGGVASVNAGINVSL